MENLCQPACLIWTVRDSSQYLSWVCTVPKTTCPDFPSAPIATWCPKITKSFHPWRKPMPKYRLRKISHLPLAVSQSLQLQRWPSKVLAPSSSQHLCLVCHSSSPLVRFSHILHWFSFLFRLSLTHNPKKWVRKIYRPSIC